jgi:hypothetical protein
MCGAEIRAPVPERSQTIQEIDFGESPYAIAARLRIGLQVFVLRSEIPMLEIRGTIIKVA